ncbi:fibrinogen- and Ig-binding protein-like [Dromaius novaehollandiae]|uniref:fibrinogen- and Ig-binding protein-like n=1 Tax=Dromaius novaehollandiae TaxID=8790 RepID=UPI00311EEE79
MKHPILQKGSRPLPDFLRGNFLPRQVYVTRGRACKMPVALTGGMAAAVLAVALAFCLPAAEQKPSQCRGCTGNGTLEAAEWGRAMGQVAALQLELGSAQRSLEEARRLWDSGRMQLDAVQRNVTALEQLLGLLQRWGSERGARTAALQEETRVLREDAAQLRQQLEEVQRSRNSLQLQVRNLQQQLQAGRKETSGGNQPPASSLGLLALALAGLLCP